MDQLDAAMMHWAQNLQAIANQLYRAGYEFDALQLHTTSARLREHAGDPNAWYEYNRFYNLEENDITE